MKRNSTKAGLITVSRQTIIGSIIQEYIADIHGGDILIG